jgi:AraC family transcriptional activator FtrA
MSVRTPRSPASIRDIRAPRVCILAYDGLCTFEFGIAVEVFGLPRPEFETWYSCNVVAGEPGPLRAEGGITITAEHDPTRLETADLVVIPGWRGANQPVPAVLCTAIRRAHAAGARIATICSGVFVAAACGLLDGRRATTHWRYLEILGARYPQITIEGAVLYVDEGDVLTSAGSAAGLDLCLHIVRGDFGASAANSVARRLVLPAHREGGQEQFVPRPVARRRGDPLMPVLDRIRTRLDETWPLARMAREAGMSERTLMRRMQEATCCSPQKWLLRERVAHAVALLESTDAGLGDVAQACGFNSVESLRHHFRKLKGCPPSWFRAHFMRAAHEAPSIMPSSG